ncbi:MAG TPA: hypothetical protein ENK63_03545 [Rhodobacterales bacterium]|nr:hypothetical protein [Rhodobacterales bacterium]
MSETFGNDGWIVIQNLTMPDPDICPDDSLFMRRDAGVFFDPTSGRIGMGAGSTVTFDTYFNLFNLGVWAARTQLLGLTLKLHGEGRALVRILRGKVEREKDMPRGSQFVPRLVSPDPDARLTRDRALVFEAELELVPEGAEIALGRLLGAQSDEGEVPPQSGLLYLEITGRDGPVALDSGAWLGRAPAVEEPVRLVMSVTSFRREAETAATAQRITEFIDAEGAAIGIRFDLQIVDNGQTLDLPAHPRLRVIPNANLGGAGGFARGLAEARKGDYTHVLFCDDDASFMVESLRRTAAFLRLARKPNAAVAGAMISAGKPWAMWENGAVFDRICLPQFVDTDLRLPHEVGRMELKTARPKPTNFYAGWWYFAFPIAAVQHDPFPFFVRGDDISFSLANDFDISPINGVVSFQEDFSAKESAFTLYLDLRNHLHHHLVQPGLDIGPWRSARLALRFLNKSIARMHYETAEAQLEAWKDVMKGPAFFEDNVDMSKRRPEILALIQAEAWREISPFASDVPELRDPGMLVGRIMRLLLNGHIIPLWRVIGRSVTVPIVRRSLLWPTWGAKQATYYDVTGTLGYTVHHSKRRGWSVMLRAGWLTLRWLRDYRSIQKAHREGYERLTSPAFWQSQFDRAEADGQAEERR